MADLLGQLVGATTVRVDTTLLPKALDIRLGGQGGGASAFVGSLVRPSITVFAGNVPVTTVAPYGDPRAGLPLWLLGVVGVLALLVWLLG